jgi:hypothetical protein
MPKSRVVLNRRGFGEQVMSSPELEAQLRPYAEEIAAQIPGATVVAIRTSVGGGGSRVRLRVEAELHERARLVAAMRAVLSNAAPR